MKRGYRTGDFRVAPFKAGGGSAEQRVRKEYPGEVKTYRRKANSQKVGLLVFIDADRNSVRTRSSHLADELARGKEDPRRENERIAHWIPKWNVETWILHLTGDEVDERRSYKKSLKGRVDFKGAAAEFELQFRQFKLGASPELPSLETAFQETRRIEGSP